MVAIQIRDVPDAVRDELVAQAKASGQSLQGYLLEVLSERADAGHNRRLLAEWARQPLVTGPGSFDAVEYIRAMREEREQELTRRALGQSE